MDRLRWTCEKGGMGEVENCDNGGMVWPGEIRSGPPWLYIDYAVVAFYLPCTTSLPPPPVPPPPPPCTPSPPSLYPLTLPSVPPPPPPCTPSPLPPVPSPPPPSTPSPTASPSPLYHPTPPLCTTSPSPLYPFAPVPGVSLTPQQSSCTDVHYHRGQAATTRVWARVGGVLQGAGGGGEGGSGGGGRRVKR